VTAWVDVTYARSLWADAPMDDALLTEELAGAQEACEAYAPATLPDPIPTRYKQAVILQCRETYEAAQRDSADVIGFGDTGIAVRVRPLGPTVRQLLRPRRGMPSVR
jgi:hypothetical protein